MIGTSCMRYMHGKVAVSTHGVCHTWHYTFTPPGGRVCGFNDLVAVAKAVPR
jgi:hypothetical protein